MPAEPLPYVLVVGTSKAGKSTLISRLCSTAAVEPARESTTWHFFTKYYEAKAKLVTLEVPDTQPGSSHPSGIEGPVEAIVLLHDCTEHGSFTAVKSWAENQGKDLSQDAAVCLAVANKVDLLRSNAERHLTDTHERPPWHEEVRGWCIDEMFEYIEAALGDQQVDEHLESDGEAQGLARIIAALHAHTWPGLKMRPQSLSRPTISSAAATAARSTSASNFPTDGSEARVGTSATSAAPFEASMDGEMRCNGSPSSIQVAHAQEHHVDRLLQPGNDLLEGMDGDAAVEQDSARMENLFAQLTVARDRVGALPSDQRREAAAAMAQQLMQHFSLDDSDSDESDSLEHPDQ
ncbi:hypothetical protein WJX74_008568 [Apatococcus lobatus]|uniref:Uncharacterized protein n=1 Tax=Apatococcus lobatus TaxID=904363 RepID=A0AAW1S0E1_9CHLO